jgi:hypothetical protein
MQPAKNVKQNNNSTKQLNNKNKQKQNKRNARRRVNSKLPQINNFKLSNCARLYLHALVNPFVQIDGPSLPCIPDYITLPSNKVQVTARGTMVLGTAGVGYVLVDPYAGISNSGSVVGSNVSFPVLYTDATYTFPNLNYLPSGGTLPTGVSGANTNSPFTITAAPLARSQVRLVGGGIRLKYSGTQLYKGGTMALYRQQDNTSIASGATNSALLQAPLSAAAPVTRDWHSVTYNPASITDVSYQTFNPYNGILGNSHYCLLIMVTGPAVNTIQQTFDFEYTAYFEQIGSNLQLSPSHSDPVGHGAIQTATANARLSVQPPAEQERSILTDIVKFAADNMSGMVNFAGTAARAAMRGVEKYALSEAISGVAPLMLAL